MLSSLLISTVCAVGFSIHLVGHAPQAEKDPQISRIRPFLPDFAGVGGD